MANGRSRVLTEADVRISHSPIRVGERAAAATGAEASGTHDSEVSVEHDAAGDVIEIRVRCSCGETTVIACDYPGAPLNQG